MNRPINYNLLILWIPVWIWMQFSWFVDQFRIRVKHKDQPLTVSPYHLTMSLFRHLQRPESERALFEAASQEEKLSVTTSLPVPKWKRLKVSTLEIFRDQMNKTGQPDEELYLIKTLAASVHLCHSCLWLYAWSSWELMLICHCMEITHPTSQQLSTDRVNFKLLNISRRPCIHHQNQAYLLILS